MQNSCNLVRKACQWERYRDGKEFSMKYNSALFWQARYRLSTLQILIGEGIEQAISIIFVKPKTPQHSS